MKCELNKYSRYLILLAFCLLAMGKGFCAEVDSTTTKIKAVVKFQPVKKSFNYGDTTIINCNFNIIQNDSASIIVPQQKTKFLDSFNKYKIDVVVLLSCGLLILSIIALCIIKFTNLIKDTTKRTGAVNVIVQIIIVLTIVFICFISNSSWAYLALVVLCVLFLDKFRPGLLSKFSRAAAAIQGKDLVTPATQAEIDNKKQEEQLENPILPQIPTAPAKQLARRRDNNNNKISVPIEFSKVQTPPYEEIERLALDYLGKQYPNLQRQVILKLGAYDKIIFDGFIQTATNNIIVEVKYCSKFANGIYDLRRLYTATDYVTQKTTKQTEILLFIVTDDKITQKRIQDRYKSTPSDSILKVEVRTKTELKQSNK